MDNKLRMLAVLFALGYGGAALASATLRVGDQVLTTGDSATRVTELLGKPSRKSRPRSTRSGSRSRGRVRVIAGDEGGERWQYRRGDHVTTITIVDGRVGDIEDRRQ
ncbi:MAG: DUF2845 domain-containing protein [Rhodanobacter sp.]